MKKTTILKGLSVISISMFILAVYYDLGWWYFGFFLSAIGFANWSAQISEMSIWNNGICKKTNKPWNFESVYELSDESIIYSFVSGKEYYNSQFIPYEILKRQNKGFKEL